MIALRAKTPEELAAWFPGMWADYKRERLEAGESEADAQRNVERNQEQLCPGGVLNPDQHVLNVFDDERVIGVLWLGDRASAGSQEWFVYDVVVDEALRGQGYGRRTMEAAETWVRARGGTRLGLNVFGPNVVARALYDSLGYQVMATTMFKEL